MLLEIENLYVEFLTARGALQAVRDVSLSIDFKESVGVVGESACGKSTLAQALMKLLPQNGKITHGSIRLDGSDLVPMSQAEIRKIRWRDISMVFQNAMTVLNPVLRIGNQIIDALQNHEQVSRDEAMERAKNLFELVGISSKRLMQYPHEFSGGMKQRAVIALSLICKPRILLADEPTTALDVVAQRQVIDLLVSLKKEYDLTLIMISHDISAISKACSMIAVMYGGQIMEYGQTNEVLLRSNNPYTRSLVEAFPSLNRPSKSFISVPGSPPDLVHPPTGCAFFPRCQYSQDICKTDNPELVPLQNGKLCRCHFPL